MMIKAKKNAAGKRNNNNKELPADINVSTETRNNHLEKRSQILQNSDPAIDSPGHSVEMDIEQVPEPPTRRESRARSNSSNSGGGGGGLKSELPNRGSSGGLDKDDEIEFGIKKFCEYIGSFSVAHLAPSDRAEFVRLQLQGLQDPKKSRPVMLFISLSGIKVCDPEDDKIVLMAHALKRVSYATCDPDVGQFAFLARNPKGPVGIQYCHVFLTTAKKEAEEINAIVAKAFKVAYASLRSKKQFYELVQELNKEQEEYFKQLTQAAEEERYLTPIELLDQQPLDSPDRVRGFVVGQNRVWAKHADGKIQHKLPHKITGGNDSPAVNQRYRPTSVPVVTRRGPAPLASISQETLTLVEEDDNVANDHEEWSGALAQDEGQPVDGVSLGGVSTEGGGEEEAAITPTAPPMTPGEISGQQELVTKQTQKCKPLPPPPYYELERADEWSVNSISAKRIDAGLRVLPESDADGCHILLQDESQPPILREVMMSADCQRGTPGQILLQDSSVPPPFVYRRDEDDSDGENVDGYHWNGYNDNDLNCDTFRSSEYSERDSFDYSRSYAILEQFINATVEGATIDEWMDPDLRLTPTEKEAPCDMFTEDSLPLVMQNGDKNHEGKEHVEDQPEEPVPKISTPTTPTTPPMGRPQPAPRRNIPKAINNQDSATTQNQSKDNDNDELVQRKRETSPGRRPQPAPRNIKSGQRSPTTSLIDNATQTNGTALLQKKKLPPSPAGSPTEEEPVIPQRPNKALLSPDYDADEQKVDNTEKKLTGPRAPGHSGHKVEIEIGQFRCKRSSSSGSAPPLPPRSTSLYGDNRNSSPIVKDAAQILKDISQASWFKAAIPREIAVEILQQEERGAFIVRESKSHPNCFALSMKVDKDFNESGIANYLVVRTKNGGYTIKGFGRDFPDLPRLIHHYSLNREQLPCALVLARSNPLYEQEEEEDDYDDDDSEEDLDYMSLTDFRSVMEGMK